MNAVKKKKLLFLGCNFKLEEIYTGTPQNNGSMAYSFDILCELQKYFDVTVLTDNPSFFVKKNFKAVNIFSDNKLDVNFSEKWRSLFCFNTDNGKIFQRDVFYRNWSIISLLNTELFNKVLNDTSYSYIVFNRIEYLFLSFLYKNQAIKKIFVTQDSQYIRKKNFSKIYRDNHPLMAVEGLYEKHLLSQFVKIIAISPNEFKYFDALYPKKTLLFRPTISTPKALAKIEKNPNCIRVYFIGSGHFYMKQQFLQAYEIVKHLRKNKWNIEFYGIGAFCKILSKSELNNNEYKILGEIEDLSKVMLDMQVQIAPITSGSGAPTKIACGLSFGHFILTTNFGKKAFEEFENKRLFFDASPDTSLRKMIKLSKEDDDDFSAYYDYSKKNNLMELLNK